MSSFLFRTPDQTRFPMLSSYLWRPPPPPPPPPPDPWLLHLLTALSVVPVVLLTLFFILVLGFLFLRIYFQVAHAASLPSNAHLAWPLSSSRSKTAQSCSQMERVDKVALQGECSWHRVEGERPFRRAHSAVGSGR